MPPSFQCLCMAVNGECMWHSSCSCLTCAARSCKEGITHVSVSAPRNRGVSRWFQASRSSRRGRSLPRTISHCASRRGDTSHQSSGTSSSAPLPTPHASLHQSPLPLPPSPWCPPPRSLPPDITPNVIWKKNVKGNEGCPWTKMQLFQCPTLYVPFSLPLLLPPSLSLPPLPHDTLGHVRSRAHSIVCHLTCSFFPAVRAMDKVLSHFGARPSVESTSRSILKSTNPAHFYRDP